MGNNVTQTHAPVSHVQRQFMNELYQTYYTSIYRYILKRVHNQCDAEDLAAITFSKALAAISSYVDHGSPQSWLITIARNVVIDYFRARRKHLPLNDATLELRDPVAQPDEVLLQAETGYELKQILDQLPAKQRLVVQLRYFRDQSTAEIAALLGLRESSVRVLLHRAMHSLRDYTLPVAS